MNRNRWTVPALLALVLATPALAGPGPGGYPRHGDDRRGPGGPGPMFDPEAMDELLDARADRIAELLDLTADQRAAFDKAIADGRDAARPRMDRMRQVGDALRAELDSSAPDPAAVGAKVIEMHQLRSELREARKMVEADLEKLLTDEQRFAFEALKESRKGSHDRRGPGRRGGPGGWDAPPPPEG